MFGHSPFYFSTIRKMVIYFGTCFNDTYITRTDTEGSVTQLMRVPLTYSPKDKLLLRADADPELQRQWAITLPRMAFEMTGLRYDEDRKMNTQGRNVTKDSSDADKLKTQYNPVPYDFDFNLYIMVKNAEDGTKITEQILPWFTPEWTATVHLIPEMNVSKDIPIVLRNVEIKDEYDGNFENRRAIIWTLSFTVKGYIYGPIVSKPIIKFSKMQFFVPQANSTVADTVGTTNVIGDIIVTPGLLANGSPTTNSALSVNTSLIEVDDDYGFCIDNSGIILNE